jgi:hypothetical protein
MASKLAIMVMAAACAVSIGSARAAGMPDTGTKNFVPGGDTPAYLTNENLAVAPGSAAEPVAATADDQAEGPERSTAAPMHWAQTPERRHGKLAAGHKSARYAAANPRTPIRSTHAASTRMVRASRSGSIDKSPRSVRAAGRTASATRTGAAVHGKASVRHAAARSAARRG